MNSRRRLHNSGFTLIEVLVALAIVAIGMAAVLGTLTSSAGTVLYLRDKNIAQWVALNRIAEQRLAGQIPQPDTKSDVDIEYAGQKWRLHEEVVGTQVPGMVRMDVMVRPSDVKGDDDKGWYVTLSGIMGDAVGAPKGDLPLWGTGMGGPGGGGGGGNPGTNAQNGNGNGNGNPPGPPPGK